MLRALVLTSAMVLVAAPAAEAAKPNECQGLKGRDLARAASIKVMIRANDRLGEDLLGCRLPDGKVRVLARTISEDTYSQYPSLRVRKIAGSWVSAELSYYGGGGVEEDSTRTENVIADAATGRRYGVAGSRLPCGSPARGRCTYGPPLRLAINQRGRAIALERGLERVVVGYNARGQATVLDEGPAPALPMSDLRLEEDIASWTHYGRTLRTRLSERQCKLSGTDLAPAEDVVLVRRSARDEEGELGSELVGCVTPAGPLRIVGSAGPFGLGEQTADADSVAGSWVLVKGNASNQYGAQGGAGVVDLRSGRSYDVFEYSCGIGTCQGAPGLSAALVNDRGQAATAVFFQGRTALTAFTSTGTRRPLESGPSAELPASSLRLTGSRASWTRNGEARSFEIAEG